MIIRINGIKSFGFYKNFTWNETLPDFKKHNLYYGWNYSGKTTLSRVFRCFELGKKHKDYSASEFEFLTDKGTFSDKDLDSIPNIRVFNEDFVEENFKWDLDEHEISPVFILGEESIELQKQLKNLQDELGTEQKEKNELEKYKEKLENEIEKKLTDKARDIGNTLSIRPFDKRHLEDKIDAISSDYEKCILKDEEYDKTLTIYKASEKKEKIASLSIVFELNEISSKVEEILNKKATAEKIIEKLKNDQRLSNWVKEGKELHKDKKVCLFCGNLLPLDLLEKLDQHFSVEYDNLIQEIESIKSETQKHIVYIEKLSFADKARLFTEFSNDYDEKIENLKWELEKYKPFLTNLINQLEQKKLKPFEILNFEQVENNENDIINILNDINKILIKHNEKVDNFEKEKSEAKEKLINHLVGQFLKESDYFKQLDEIQKKPAEIKQKENETLELKIKVGEIEKKIFEEVKGAKRINEYLNEFFNDDDLRIEVTENKTYKLFRSDKTAKNLSAGEKNIISLLYFFTKLEEKGNKLEDLIVFIDDPVSSLDNNHQFKVYAFIKTKLQDCGQLFVTTHNFEFFNLMKDFIKYDCKDYNGTGYGNNVPFYLVKKVKKNGSDYESILEKLPDILIKHKSEYNYLFSILNEFNNSYDKSNYDLLYVIPNIARRFLEAYLCIRYPNGKKFKDKANIFFKDSNQNEKECVLKILDEYSHEQSIDHSLKFSDVSETEEIVKIILEQLKSKDNDHFAALCESCNS